MNTKGKQIQEYATIINDLPTSILVDIFLRLTTKRIIICKRVCKTWYLIIADPEFAKLQFSQAQAHPLIQPQCTYENPTLYLIELEDVQSDQNRWNFDVKLTIPVPDSPNYLVNGELNEAFMSYVRTGNEGNLFNVMRKTDLRKNTSGKWYPENSKYEVLNSCNGLLCLAESTYITKPAVICNPVTGEYIKLPQSCYEIQHSKSVFTYQGLGFDPNSIAFKVIRASYGQSEESSSNNPSKFWELTEIYKFETCSWTILNNATPPYFPSLELPTYVNGFLYWIPLIFGFHSEERDTFLVAFDMETEQFSLAPLPPDHSGIHTMGLGVLKGELCVTVTSGTDYINIWVMKEDDFEKHWTKMLTIQTSSTLREPAGVSLGLIKPICCYDEGPIFLMYHSHSTGLVYYYQKTQTCRYQRLNGQWREIISHTPCLITLKEIVKGYNVEGFNVSSRILSLN